MITDEQIARINELYHKRQRGEASEEEIAEHEALRKEYIAAFRANLRSQLDTITIENPDGTRVNLGEKHGEKKEEN